MAARRTCFLLSPANLAGRRARMVLRAGAGFDLAATLRNRGAPIGQVFAFISGLYFRGKLTYAYAFANPATRERDVLVITPDRGLVPAQAVVTADDLRRMAGTPIDPDQPPYRQRLERDARALAASLKPGDRVVLLGSIATARYVSVLLDVLGDQLHFPAEFVGRGDMSRGGLMLRCVDEERELRYIPVRGAPRHGRDHPDSRHAGEGRKKGRFSLAAGRCEHCPARQRLCRSGSSADCRSARSALASAHHAKYPFVSTSEKGRQ